MSRGLGSYHCVLRCGALLFRPSAKLFQSKSLHLNWNGNCPIARPFAVKWHSTGPVSDVITQMKSQGVSDIIPRGIHLEITWNDETASRFYSLWLRKNCHCRLCRHDNGQLLLPSFSLPESLTVKSASIKSENGALNIDWNEEDHVTTIPLQYLKDNCYSDKSLQKESKKLEVSVCQDLREHHYEDLLSAKDNDNSFLTDLNEVGLVLVKGVPQEPDKVNKVAEIVSHVQETFYGKSFSVESTENAINLAYTPDALELHMDLVYFQSPPGLQLLHCLRFDEQVEGGESVFLDSILVAQEMQQNYPELFETLLRVPATFQKIHFDREVPAAYIYRKPHITVTPEGKINSLIWSPPFEGPLRVPEKDVEPYYKAYRKLAELIYNSKQKISKRLQPGDCIVFNNIRILHARHAFMLNGGKRHLMGCYVNIDDFKSRVQVVHMKKGSGTMAKRVNNGDWS
ncbi:probable gamma-butyrobetaine dioxygenase isoform X1 [Asterias rubens]|uniref:probable gamma-butyrobetaine dioxygenase isoform X1 n=1 Tax=Asterias rubens TaxID=7604 RepID=UPI001454ECC9|nr:probable gamma-butyrobetaine dioxygenase isoform X1 [Asterias rubens]XP_033630330.1 probable gamma-butyrobetaine dioxygenase isoform X1 [Asterias rubens]XP_033630337.1 probable gamma-butyrobetaine dioxygenase isoform X1 [Asterias rubens]XP_033630344.1 probable gamma-butyrobetaine dioxygenase isoform X1 [Asterias rubens]XP_033630351.1 probable gamma-butyrobetaine dioxygenase isoform X1 [Asterias rubens]